MRTKREALRALVTVALASGAAAALGLARVHRAAPAPVRTIVASIRAEPRSFNRYVARDLTTTVVTYLTQASLVRVNHTTDRLEPELAASWDLLPDQRTYRLHLRPNVRFSDGMPFTADDVAFSFRAIYDPESGSLLADSLLVGGQPLAVTADDAKTVTIRFPAPFGPGLRILDGVPMLPRHRLAQALAAGTFASAWSVSTSPSEVAGLGPFRLVSYQPGQRLTFERNPLFWAAAGGGPAPTVDRMVLEIIPDQASESLRLQSGAIDFTESEIRASDYAAVKRATDAGTLRLSDLGVGLDGDLLWMNLKRTGVDDRPWLRTTEFRRAVSRAVDRDAFVRTVYLGAAVPGYTLVSPGNRDWYVDQPAPAFDVPHARERLASLGLADRNGDGLLEDAAGRPVRFALLTQGGNTSLERGAAFIRESLAHVGVTVDVVTLDAGALVDRIMSGAYDAAYFRLLTTDTDPTLNSDFWLTSGSAHVWNPTQRTPATEWEREIDRLMIDLSTTIDPARRKALFTDVQRIVAREVPALCFAFPRMSYAMNTRVAHATPAAFRPPVLWNPSAINLRPES